MHLAAVGQAADDNQPVRGWTAQTGRNEIARQVAAAESAVIQGAAHLGDGLDHIEILIARQHVFARRQEAGGEEHLFVASFQKHDVTGLQDNVLFTKGQGSADGYPQGNADDLGGPGP
jgi:hypothetical protein